MLLATIIFACVLATGIAIVAARGLNERFLDRYGERITCFSTGLLLTLAFTHLLPEAFESSGNPHSIGITLWAACFGLLMLEQVFDLHHHGKQAPGKRAAIAHRGALPVIVGDSLHTFTDGIVIASSFLVSPSLGWAITAGILLHEIPQEVGDYALLTRFGLSRDRAFRLLLIAGAAAATGGVLGYLVLDRIRAMLPYALALSAASFLYIAMCELVPRITAGVSDRRSFWRLAVLLLAGAAVAFLIGIEH